MKDTYLMVNGQKIELTEEQKKQLGIVEEKSCFERNVAVTNIRNHDKPCNTCIHGIKGENDCLENPYAECEWE